MGLVYMPYTLCQDKTRQRKLTDTGKATMSISSSPLNLRKFKQNIVMNINFLFPDPVKSASQLDRLGQNYLVDL